MRTSEKNRFTNALTVGNCKLDMVFSDIFGKSSSAIISTILSQNEYNDEDILKNIDKHCKSSNEDILKSINGISWETAQKQRMNIIQEHIDYLNESISKEYKDVDYLGEHLFDEFLFKNGFTEENVSKEAVEYLNNYQPKEVSLASKF